MGVVLILQKKQAFSSGVTWDPLQKWPEINRVGGFNPFEKY